MPFFAYMIKFDNGYLYTGSTGKIRIRTQQHWRKGDHPVVIWKQVFGTREEALDRERQIKGWTRAKKLALASGDIAALKSLSRRRGGLPPTPHKATNAWPEVPAPFQALAPKAPSSGLGQSA